MRMKALIACAVLLMSCACHGLINLNSTPTAPLVVWTDTPWQAITPGTKPPANPSLTINLAAARGGIASGLVLVSGAPGPVVAKAEELKGPGGTIPVQLRYATRRLDLGPAVGGAFEGAKLVDGFDFGQTGFLDALSETPVTNEPVQAVWVTVDVPATAQPGEYQGKIVVEGKTVQVSASVSAFTVPPPGDRKLYLAGWLSPDSVAVRYGVTPWTDEHYKLLEPSLKLAGRMGVSVLHVPVVGHTYFGHRTGLIFFTRKGEELVPDFSAFERYLDLWVKQVGKPRQIALEVYTNNPRSAAYSINDTVEVTVRGVDGKFEQVKTPIYEKNFKMWKAVVEGVQERTAKIGLARYHTLLGMLGDVRAFKEVADVFQSIDPDLGWVAWRHVGYNMPVKPIWDAKYRVGLNYGPGGPVTKYSWFRGCPPSEAGPQGGIFVTPLRCLLMDSSPLNDWRRAPDGVGYGTVNGFGPLGLDLWPLPPKLNGRNVAWNMRSFAQEWGPNIDRASPTRCTVPGPNGALSTTRLEAYAEGACETEARLTIDLAVTAKKTDAAKARAVEEARYKGFPAGVMDATQIPADWNVSLSALYDLAAEAQKALGDKK